MKVQEPRNDALVSVSRKEGQEIQQLGFLKSKGIEFTLKTEAANFSDTLITTYQTK
jgi:hypothetical protein